MKLCEVRNNIELFRNAFKLRIFESFRKIKNFENFMLFQNKIKHFFNFSISPEFNIYFLEIFTKFSNNLRNFTFSNNFVKL